MKHLIFCTRVLSIIFYYALFPTLIFVAGCRNKSSVIGTTEALNSYPIHKNIVATVFWVGEPSGPDNNYIPNEVSAWDDSWQIHYGGVDDPVNRNGYYPALFTPNENPFYFALPYDDLDDLGSRKKNVSTNIYWWTEKNWSNSESACKNRWIKITKGSLTVYAQWEDVGPFETDDINYVFGNSLPANKFNAGAGLDVSPAVETFLGLTGNDKVNWQFVNFRDVPSGPWKSIITTSQLSFTK